MISKVSGSIQYKRMLSVFLVALAVLILGLSAPVSWAHEGDDDEGDKATIPLADAKIIFETNFTDRDTGIQISVDGEPWKKVQVKGPDNELLKVEGKGNLKGFGLTEMFFESNEPNYDDLSLAEILSLFPAGVYEFEGKTVEGDKLEGKATLSHALPCGPEVSAAVGGADDVTINWLPVTSTLDPAKGACAEPPVPVAIDSYHVIVENDHTFTIDLPGDATSVTVPPEFLEPGTAYKVEVLAIAENGNQTITESEFSTP